MVAWAKGKVPVTTDKQDAKRRRVGSAENNHITVVYNNRQYASNLPSIRSVFGYCVSSEHLMTTSAYELKVFIQDACLIMNCNADRRYRIGIAETTKREENDH